MKERSYTTYVMPLLFSVAGLTLGFVLARGIEQTARGDTSQVPLADQVQATVDGDEVTIRVLPNCAAGTMAVFSENKFIHTFDCDGKGASEERSITLNSSALVTMLPEGVWFGNREPCGPPELPDCGPPCPWTFCPRNEFQGAWQEFIYDGPRPE